MFTYICAHVIKMADIRVGEKRLDQLKVAELRDLLEKRGLSKTGVKVELVKRLTEVSLESCFFPCSSVFT